MTSLSGTDPYQFPFTIGKYKLKYVRFYKMALKPRKGVNRYKIQNISWVSMVGDLVKACIILHPLFQKSVTI